MSYSGLERRRYKRIRHHFIISLRVYPEITSKNNAKWDMAAIENLSAAGMFFTYNKKLETGTLLEFKITLPFLMDRTRCLGVVRRVEEKPPAKIYGIGIYFVEIDGKRKDAINKAANDYYFKKGVSD
ncbi:MAG: PilZ domain-containing protein [Candidatus Omnitrophota bacterium]|nr:PilZ domain-containing protein [Candidatus Omnitrophota bacterium]